MLAGLSAQLLELCFVLVKIQTCCITMLVHAVVAVRLGADKYREVQQAMKKVAQSEGRPYEPSLAGSPMPALPHATM